MLRYPIVLTPDDNDTLLVTSPDFPELKSFGKDHADAGLVGGLGREHPSYVAATKILKQTQTHANLSPDPRQYLTYPNNRAAPKSPPPAR